MITQGGFGAGLPHPAAAPGRPFASAPGWREPPRTLEPRLLPASPGQRAGPCPVPGDCGRGEEGALGRGECAEPSRVPQRSCRCGGRNRRPAQPLCWQHRLPSLGPAEPPGRLLPAGLSRCRSLLRWPRPCPLLRPSAPAVREPRVLFAFRAFLPPRCLAKGARRKSWTCSVQFTRIKTPFLGQGTRRWGLEAHGGLARRNRAPGCFRGCGCWCGAEEGEPSACITAAEPLTSKKDSRRAQGWCC